MKNAALAILALASLAAAVARSAPEGAAIPPGRVALKIDTSEAEAVLAILSERAAGRSVPEQSWRDLVSTEPYRRLKAREDALRVGFSDADFRRFVLSDELAARREGLAATLAKWKGADLDAAASRALSYLPPSAVIRASVYPMIKPKTNSFVFETATRPAIFLYLDPAIPAEKFQNTIAHELHHIGFASVTDANAGDSRADPKMAAALEWFGALGEGFAMLAAAGSPDVHPHATSPARDRERWDGDMANFNRDLRALDRFFRDVLEGKLASRDKVDAAGAAFFGEQGPWYTVGYRMAVVIEKHDGRPALIACMSDPRKLIAAYDRDAADDRTESGEKLALWSPELVEELGRPQARGAEIVY